MNQRTLGRTQLHVAELCLSTAPLGRVDDAAAFALLDTYQAAGGNFIQSPGFCPNADALPPIGTAPEDVVGRWRETRAIGRDRVVLATRVKFVRPAHGGSIAFANTIRESCERSLQRLRTRHLDLLICDWDEGLLPVDDVLDAVDRLIRAGLVRYAVAGDFPPWRIVDSLHRSSARNRVRFEALQGGYSLLTRARFEAEALAMCREHRLGFLARSPLAGGSLAAPFDGLYPAGSPHAAVLAVLSDLAHRRGVSPARIALAWVLRQPEVSSALVSTTSPRELNDLSHATRLVLDHDEIEALAEVTSVPDERMELRPA